MSSLTTLSKVEFPTLVLYPFLLFCFYQTFPTHDIIINIYFAFDYGPSHPLECKLLEGRLDVLNVLHYPQWPEWCLEHGGHLILLSAC